MVHSPCTFNFINRSLDIVLSNDIHVDKLIHCIAKFENTCTTVVVLTQEHCMCTLKEIVSTKTCPCIRPSWTYYIVSDCHARFISLSTMDVGVVSMPGTMYDVLLL